MIYVFRSSAGLYLYFPPYLIQQSRTMAFMAFIFFCISFASAIWQRVLTRLCCGELILKYLSPVM